MSDHPRKYELKVRARQFAQTRQRIIEAAASLHLEVGPARTTVTDIARRAGVRRTTVYNHFPDDRDLFAACGDYSLANNPPPDATAALALTEPTERLHAVLHAYYHWYRKAAPSMEKLQRDRHSLPALDAAMSTRVDTRLAQLTETLTSALAPTAAPEDPDRQRLYAVIALALDFWTWRRLTDEGLHDDSAAAVMATAVQAVLTHQST